jgi:hypothetical protein
MTQVCTMQIDGVSFSLREEHDFHWLQQEGRVFTVFDRQDSGNISFGVERDGLKRFIKYGVGFFVGKVVKFLSFMLLCSCHPTLEDRCRVTRTLSH